MKEGYDVTFRNFDLQKQKVKLLTATVAALEKITVAGGSFDSYRVE